MKSTRTIAAVIGSSLVISVAALATAAIADDDPPTRTAPAQTGEYVEPSSDALGDGTYLGYVRLTGLPDTTVAVDLVAVTDGAIENTQPELLVDAGLLAKVDIFDLTGRPFRIVIQDETVVEVQTADDILGSQAPTAHRLVGSNASFSTTGGEVSVVIDGKSYDLADWLVADWDISDSEWWEFERRVLKEVIDTLKNQ